MTNPPPRPDFIRNWREFEMPEQFKPRLGNETFGFPVQMASTTGLSRVRVLHMRLPPGMRTNPPMAWKDEEEFYFVLEGTPDLWADGHLYRLKEGDAVAFPEGTGISHSFLNNTDKDVNIFAMGEAMRYASKAYHPLAKNAGANENLKRVGKLWAEAPKHELGPHDGDTDAKRGSPSPDAARKKNKPDFVVNWRDIIANKPRRYPSSDEDQTLDAPFGWRFRYGHLGIRFQVLKPGRRTSWPHAERSEEEFVYVVAGQVDCWVDGWLHPMKAGDIAGFAALTGITHTIINNSKEDAWLLAGSVASRQRNEFFYVFHEQRNKDIGELCWRDHPKLNLGPHDGLPDALRKTSAKPGAKKTSKPAKAKPKPAKRKK